MEREDYIVIHRNPPKARPLATKIGPVRVQGQAIFPYLVSLSFGAGGFVFGLYLDNLPVATALLIIIPALMVVFIWKFYRGKPKGYIEAWLQEKLGGSNFSYTKKNNPFKSLGENLE